VTGSVRALLVRPVLLGWTRHSAQSWRDYPRPDDAPHVESSGPDTVRILILGSGPNFGYGVRSHQISLGGQLSRLLAQHTGRGVDVVIATVSEMRTTDSRELLDKHGAGFDALVTTFGSFEAYRLQSASRWGRSVHNMLDEIQRWNPQVETFFGGIVPVGSLVVPPNFARSALEQRGRELNDTSELICDERSRVTFVPFPRSETNDFVNQRAEQYRLGALALVAPIAKWIATTMPPLASA
jgi:hypothetical protein